MLLPEARRSRMVWSSMDNDAVICNVCQVVANVETAIISVQFAQDANARRVKF